MSSTSITVGIVYSCYKTMETNFVRFLQKINWEYVNIRTIQTIYQNKKQYVKVKGQNIKVW